MNLKACLLFSSLLLMALPCAAKEFSISNGDTKALLKAITLCNESPEADVIILARNGLYAIDKPIHPHFLLPPLKNKLTIEGNGSEIRRYVKAAYAHISIEKNSDIILRSLTLAEGSEGAIINRGNLQLDRVKIIDTDSGKAKAIISNWGRMSLSNTELAYNHIPIQAHDAGVIINHGELSLSFSMIHNNTVRLNRNRFALALGALNFGNIKINGFSIADNDIDPEIQDSQISGIINIGSAKIHGRFPEKLVLRKQ
jgi:hypothetical protein